MYIKSMVLEGFKSYGRRIEINGFDKEFNAITGFNGSGKSNVLDGICFVLGITNLTQVRATSLQDLVYKSGQAGIRKASVTITFDNRDKKLSPIGYEHQQEITVTRQVEIGGKNKYMINGTTVQNKRVQDMFCSVQLNVNNPHFLIMQGRITKVLNMKPAEILSMVEEAAGTRMYETKKQLSLKTIAKKDNKLKEIKDILTEEIGPKLEKLREERIQFVEYQYVERELEQYRRMFIAWNYVTAIKHGSKAQEDLNEIEKKIETINNNVTAGVEELKTIEEKLAELYERRDGEQGKKLQSAIKELQETEKKQSTLIAEANGKKEHIKAVVKSIEQLKHNISDEESTLVQKEKGFNKVGGTFQRLKELEKQDSEALNIAQERFQKISAGLLENNDGENATLENQLINAKQAVIESQTAYKQCQMSLSHSKQQLKLKEKDLSCTEGENKKDNEDLEQKEKELKNIQNELNKLNYNEEYVESLKNQKHVLHNEIKELQNKIDQFESRHPQTRFNYRDPERNFNRNSVKGMVCKLFKVKDNRAAYALEVVSGGKLYNVVVDTENTSKKVLQNGQLQQRVTIIPLNRVQGRPMNQQTIHLAQNLVGADNVHPALSLVEFSNEVRPAMEWIFGQIFVCANMDVAKKVAFHKNIMKKCVTLDGDVFDPAGTLSGGALSKGGSLLLKLDEVARAQTELDEKRQTLIEVENTLANVGKMAEKYASLKQRYDLRNYEMDLIKQRLQQTTHHKIKEEVQNLKMEISELTDKITTLKQTENDNANRVKELEKQLGNAVKIREKQLREVENELTVLRKKAEASRNEWKKREQEAGTLELEMKELKQTIENSKTQLEKQNNELETLKENAKGLEDELNEIKCKVESLHGSVKELKDIANRENKQIHKLTTKKDEIIQQSEDAKLEIKKLNHAQVDIQNRVTDCKNKIAALTEKHDWIEQDKNFFGKSGGIYDFDAHDPEDTKKKMQLLEASRDKLSRKINMRAINLLDKEEEQYNEMMKKKRIVETDKKKILETIRHLDEKKEQTLYTAWEQVNKDFGSIFSSLLPGATAKLVPPENQRVTEGLEVKIGFSGVWKESLAELSGGQRSLVALSLILAMLLFKPAPLYILDEVDAALDLSHTENIGSMLKRHFTHSQFIVVSLKDGMFNNANVLFTTKFVDGMSTVHRAERSKK